MLGSIGIALVASATAAEISVESAPPVVIRTVPTAGVNEVDPTITELRVTFSKTMKDDNWLWTTWGQENFPRLMGKPKYLADGRTCVVQVKLEPGKFYATWLNSEQHKNFKDTAGRPAVPYLLTFTTAAAKAPKANWSGLAEALLRGFEQKLVSLGQDGGDFFGKGTGAQGLSKIKLRGFGGILAGKPVVALAEQVVAHPAPIN